MTTLDRTIEEPDTTNVKFFPSRKKEKHLPNSTQFSEAYQTQFVTNLFIYFFKFCLGI